MTDKSINASERLEMRFNEYNGCKKALGCPCFRWGCTYNPCSLLNIAPASGINPTHGLERAY
jgi:hypothetical protein